MLMVLHVALVPSVEWQFSSHQFRLDSIALLLSKSPSSDFWHPHESGKCVTASFTQAQLWGQLNLARASKVDDYRPTGGVPHILLSGLFESVL